MENEKETTTISVSKDTKKDLMLFKVQTDAKSLEEVLRNLIPKLKKELEILEKGLQPSYSKEQSKGGNENESERRSKEL